MHSSDMARWLFTLTKAASTPATILTAHCLEGSMSRRGNCHYNAIAESFFQLLKRERVKRKIYPRLDMARADIFDYLQVFYNSRRRHSSNEQLSCRR
jgi:putative transposase